MHDPYEREPADNAPSTKPSGGEKKYAPFQQRVMEEKAQLDERLEKLHVFYSLPQYAALPIEEKARLLRQKLAMLSYTRVLGERIAAFVFHVEPNNNSHE